MKSVREVMTSEISSCTADDHLFDAATLMKERNVGALPVVGSNQELLGMVTDRDLVIRGYANKKPGSTPIQEVMSDKLYHVMPDATLQEASEVMADHQVRRLPVVEQGKLVGILSLGDLSLDDMSDQAAGKALEEISERPELH
ncbi:CBS domain-containing protein [Thalassobacillus devorans]|uniref:CBS domain-containing protein n=1 Tax=Thalassobacillus devorans TaxID=279813 RepID=A0ABQ1NPT1_9BACI|nr:CBS domain-containing protein [Thalassobacillus devorans]NIK27781.1 CBS domain-containing protein [Thalassobacillus devorans]GGC80389.1 CBS domain-containing protein [Thalassobacillus devorans]